MPFPPDLPPRAAGVPPRARQAPYQAPPDVFGDISGASHRLRALAALSGSLTDSLSPEDAAGLVEQKALSALGATSAVVITLGPFPPVIPAAGAPPDRQTLTVVHAIGLPHAVRDALEDLPLSSPVPLAEVAREGQPLFLSSDRELRRYPEWGGAMINGGAQAAAIVPVWANGELRGVLGLTWPARRAFDEDERAFVITLGVMCAQAIMRAHLKSAELAARRAAEHANEAKAQFLATISHELRTPMNAVMGYTELLADEIDGPISALQKDHLGRARASGKHLLGLIEDLLGYARIEAGEETVRPEPVLLGDVVEESILLVQPMAEKKGLRIRVEGTPAPVELQTDRRKLSQILVNLLANAVKFTVEGDVLVVLRVAGIDAEVKVYIEVTDTGRGISAENHEHVFEAFWQEAPGAAQTSGSTGLGLAVARKLARLLGGDVVLARSVPGVGSTLVVSIPPCYRAAAEFEQH